MSIHDIADQLDGLIRAEKWYDFYVASLTGTTLHVRGTLDATFGYNLDIHFDGVRYLDAPMQWKTDTEVDRVMKVFGKDDLDPALRRRFFDQGGEYAIGFLAECFDSQQWFFVVADDIAFTHGGKWDSWQWYEGEKPPPLAGHR